MLLYLNNYTTEVIGYNDVINEADAKQYVNGIDCVWVEGLKIEKQDVDYKKQVRMYFNGTQIEYITEDIVIKENETQKINSIIIDTHETTQTVAGDNLLNMELISVLDDKLNLIMEHLGLC